MRRKQHKQPNRKLFVFDADNTMFYMGTPSLLPAYKEILLSNDDKGKGYLGEFRSLIPLYNSTPSFPSSLFSPLYNLTSQYDIPEAYVVRKDLIGIMQTLKSQEKDIVICTYGSYPPEVMRDLILHYRNAYSEESGHPNEWNPRSIRIEPIKDAKTQKVIAYNFYDTAHNDKLILCYTNRECCKNLIGKDPTQPTFIPKAAVIESLVQKMDHLKGTENREIVLFDDDMSNLQDARQKGLRPVQTGIVDEDKVDKVNGCIRAETKEMFRDKFNNDPDFRHQLNSSDNYAKAQQEALKACHQKVTASKEFNEKVKEKFHGKLCSTHSGKAFEELGTWLNAQKTKEEKTASASSQLPPQNLASSLFTRQTSELESPLKGISQTGVAGLKESAEAVDRVFNFS